MVTVEGVERGDDGSVSGRPSLPVMPEAVNREGIVSALTRLCASHVRAFTDEHRR